MRVWLVALLMLPFVDPAVAQTTPSSQAAAAAARAELDTRIGSVEAALARIRAEQQSTYQLFQMVQEMRRLELGSEQQAFGASAYPNPPPDYDNVMRDKRARQDRQATYASEMNRLYARYRDLEEQKRPLLEQLQDLLRQRR